MTDDMDPRAIEEQSQAEQENYKLYRRRWLVLFAMFSVNLVVGLNRCLLPIADILDDFMEITHHDYEILMQVSMYTILVSVLATARALDYFGLRRCSYFACLVIICANALKASCVCDERFVPSWVKQNRFHILLLSEVFVGLAQAIASCVPAKVAGSWFAHYESTLAMVIANCGYNVGVGFSNYFTPIFVRGLPDIYKLSYMFLVSGVVVTFIVLTCVTRSSPKMPPSSSAIMSASTIVPLKSGITVMISNLSYVWLLLTINVNISIMSVTQFVLEDILKAQQYSNTFCGILIAHAYFFGTFFMLMGAAWVDNSANYVKVSRISSILCALSTATFVISITLPNIKNVILVTNVMASFGCSLMYPALFQVCIRCATTILADATVAAIMIVLQQLMSALIMNSFGPLKKMSLEPGGYQAPMIIFACIMMIVNFLYATSFRAPSRDELQEKLRNQGTRTILVEELSS